MKPRTKSSWREKINTGQWVTVHAQSTDAKARALAAPKTVKTTSFATFKDLVGYIKCLQSGRSSTSCYAVGDNGVGAWGDVTAQIHTPMCAISPQDMIDRFGSSKAARGKKVKVVFMWQGLKKVILCEVRDKGPAGVCDLNPAAMEEAGMPIDTELNVRGTYEWA